MMSQAVQRRWVWLHEPRGVTDTLQIDCLKYLVLANMLMKSNVDPFGAPEV